MCIKQIYYYLWGVVVVVCLDRVNPWLTGSQQVNTELCFLANCFTHLKTLLRTPNLSTSANSWRHTRTRTRTHNYKHTHTHTHTYQERWQRRKEVEGKESVKQDKSMTFSLSSVPAPQLFPRVSFPFPIFLSPIMHLLLHLPFFHFLPPPFFPQSPTWPGGGGDMLHKDTCKST